MNDEPQTPRAARQTREAALAHAITLASQQQTGNYNGQIVVNMATLFEDYLNGVRHSETENDGE